MSARKNAAVNRKHGTGTVRPRGDGYDARWCDADGKECSRRFTTEAAAHEFLDEQMVAKRKAKKSGARYRSPNDLGPTVTEEAAAWLADRARDGRTPMTLVSYHGATKYVTDYFGTRRIGTLTVKDVESFQSSLLDRGLAPATVTKIMRALKPIMKRAKRLGHITTNPCDDLERKRKKVPPKPPTTIDSALVELLAECIEPAHYRPLFTFMAWTGVRAGEAAELRWGDLDIANEVVHVRRSVAEISLSTAERAKVPGVEPGFHVGPPKNGHPRQTVLDPGIAALLGTPGTPDDLVFTMERGGRIRWENVRKRVWLPAVARAVERSEAEGLTPFPPNLRIHDLRHAFVSIAYHEVAYNPAQIAEMSGHLDLAVMLNVYVHVFKGWDTQRASRFGAVREAARLRLIEGGKEAPQRRAS